MERRVGGEEVLTSRAPVSQASCRKGQLGDQRCKALPGPLATAASLGIPGTPPWPWLINTERDWEEEMGTITWALPLGSGRLKVL